jgi:hypothetical protein
MKKGLEMDHAAYRDCQPSKLTVSLPLRPCQPFLPPVLKVPTLLPRPSKSLVHYAKGSVTSGKAVSKPAPTCEMCDSPKRGHRKLNYTKGDGSTGQLVVCSECASAWKTTQHEDGVWALTIDLDKI